MQNNEKSYKEKQEEEVENNFIFFQDELKNLLPENYGKFALIKNQKIADFFETREDASKAGRIAYQDKIFSIQEVTEEVIDLGYYSHAIVQMPNS